ncbi:hypothetical protein [Ruegeria sp.]|uniref:hypothetical protein n=1 Tax=Ruegeria sp. TaxID=1879320 RepID=UPI003AFFCBF6
MPTINPLHSYDAQACRALWQAVLVRMLRDLASDSYSTARERGEAERWVGDYPSRAFRDTCELAGFDPGHIHRNLRRWLDDGTITTLDLTIKGADTCPK